MSALYIMRYIGMSGFGAGAMYIGKGIISGIDSHGGIYDGSYTQSGGRFRGKVVLTFPEGGKMVTGKEKRKGESLPLEADWPSNFSNGLPQTISILGQDVHATFQKLRDIP